MASSDEGNVKASVVVEKQEQNVVSSSADCLRMTARLLEHEQSEALTRELKWISRVVQVEAGLEVVIGKMSKLMDVTKELGNMTKELSDTVVEVQTTQKDTSTLRRIPQRYSGGPVHEQERIDILEKKVASLAEEVHVLSSLMKNQQALIVELTNVASNQGQTMATLLKKANGREDRDLYNFVETEFQKVGLSMKNELE